MAADTTYPAGVVQIRQDGNLAVPTGKSIDIESGGALKVAGTDVTGKISAEVATSGGTAYETVAAAGSVQGDAAAMVADFVLVTGADATKGVILPTPAAGRRIVVKNNAGSVLKVYPATGGAINAIAANTAISLAANVPAMFIASSATQWWTLPLLPS